MTTLNTLMEFHHPHIKMELGEMDSNLGAFWSPAFEDDVFNSTFVWRDRGEGSFVTAENGNENRRKLATELLEVLDSSKIQHDSKSHMFPNVKTANFLFDRLSFGSNNNLLRKYARFVCEK